MTDEFSNLEVLPAVPLEYFERHTGPWVVVVRIMAWTGIIYSAIVIASEFVWVLLYLLDMIAGPRSFGLNLSNALLTGFCPAVAGCVLLSGSAMSLTFQNAGRTIVLWASAGVVAAWVLAFGIAEIQYVVMREVPSPMYAVYQTVSFFFQNLFRAFPAVVLWIIFHRREVRDVFEG